MPQIREYTSKIDKLTPDDRGNAAWETAARRMAPLYRQMGEDKLTGARLANKLVEQQKDFYNDWFKLGAEDAAEDERSAKEARGGGGGVNVARGGGDGRQSSPREYVDPATQRYRDPTAAAAALTQAAKKAAAASDPTMTLADYEQQKNDLYSKIANGGEATASELEWFNQEQYRRGAANRLAEQELRKYQAARTADDVKWTDQVIKQQNKNSDPLDYSLDQLDKQAAAEAKFNTQFGTPEQQSSSWSTSNWNPANWFNGNSYDPAAQQAAQQAVDDAWNSDNVDYTGDATNG